MGHIMQAIFYHTTRKKNNKHAENKISPNLEDVKWINGKSLCDHKLDESNIWYPSFPILVNDPKKDEAYHEIPKRFHIENAEVSKKRWKETKIWRIEQRMDWILEEPQPLFYFF